MTALSNKFIVIVESQEMVEEIEEQEQLDTSEMESLTAELEEEQKKIKQIQSDIEAKMRSPASVSSAGTPRLSQEEKAEADGRSVYVGNVDYSVTAEELETHFHGCGSVNRVTILCDKFSGHPKGFAYVEFSEKEGAENALSMTDSLLKGRQIKVNLKRTNKPGISTTNRGGRGRGGRGGARGGIIVKYIYAGGFGPYRGGGAGRGFRRPSRF